MHWQQRIDTGEFCLLRLQAFWPRSFQTAPVINQWAHTCKDKHSLKHTIHSHRTRNIILSGVTGVKVLAYRRYSEIFTSSLNSLLCVTDPVSTTVTTMINILHPVYPEKWEFMYFAIIKRTDFQILFVLCVPPDTFVQILDSCDV